MSFTQVSLRSSSTYLLLVATLLKEYGFTQKLSDYYLFALVDADGNLHLHVLVYVDNLIISGSSTEVIQQFKDYLSSCFRMKDL